MIFTIFTTVVFVAELIIAFALIACLAEADRKIFTANAFFTESKPKIKSVAQLSNKISAQILELIPIWLDEMRKKRDKIIQKNLESFISSALFWGLNFKIIKKMKKMKFLRAVMKGLSFVKNMI